jgi:DNA-binding NarL/FixJ family response regulator
MSHDKSSELNKKHRVLLIDDHPIVREGLSQMINAEDDLEVIATAEDARTALDQADDLEPDIAVVDLSLKEGSGLDLIKSFKARKPSMPVLVLSMHDESLHAERVLRAGAKGYIMKQEATEKVITAIRKVLGGEVYLSDKMSAQMLNRLVGTGGTIEASPITRLTDREYEIYSMIGHGVGTREIAQKLSLSIKTVEAHRENIKDKLDLKNANELLRHAMQHVQDLR